MHVTIPVELGVNAYHVDVHSNGWSHFAAGVRRRVGASRIFVVSDSEVGRLWKSTLMNAMATEGLELTWIEIPCGEQHKTSTTWLDVVHQLSENGVQRDSWVIAFGGGVVGDMAGFAAASIVRGIRWIQVPTTLLAMVDASVGGKTAINLPIGKNLLGAFHQPSWVYACVASLNTLPQKEFRSGLGEVMKMAALEGGEFWSWMTEKASLLHARHPQTVLDAIVRCVAMKARVVCEDEKECGPRMLLNAGHTLGHGIEAALGFGTLTHGEAVALGVLYECQYALSAGICEDASMVDAVKGLMTALELDIRIPNIDPERLKSAIFLDKKAVGNTIGVPLPVGLGRYRIEWLGQREIDALIRTVIL